MEYAVLMNPKAQTRVQEEIDCVIGADRLPTFEDEPRLPYVTALAKKSSGGSRSLHLVRALLSSAFVEPTLLSSVPVIPIVDGG